uniref:Solute carrier family 2, facilitated glucose transporter member 2 (Trinotate prediction) n=1 Tax=Myxobolus squamalis TaxID=59785 RepID=A0A6B2G5H1_MYXSQ
MVHISTAAFGAILLLTTIALPESPKFIYYHTKSSEKTETAFRKLRGRYYSQNEVEIFEKSIDESSGFTQLSVSEFICKKKYRLPIISLIVLHIGQQLCGINAIMAFAPSLLRSAGFNKPDVGGVIITSIGLLGSILFVLIALKSS